METFALYLIKSTVWLTGFFLIYIAFLRNERFFTLNRIYLVSGILVSIIFPLFTWHYTVIFPVTPTAEVLEPQVVGVTTVDDSFPIQKLLLYFYLTGALYLIFRLIKQTVAVWKVIRNSETHHFNSIKLIRTDRYPASFSFFSFVFVNPSIDEPETSEIVNHEQEHIRQQHWIDLLLFEILRTMHWFNPVSWLYGRLIRQNHEYLADERALQRTSNPAIYRAALLNQMFGGPVISLANSFNYSLNKKRFNMMKQITYSPFRKLKILLVLPLIAGVFYAFATPEYKFVQAAGNTEVSNAQQNLKTVKGKVVKEDGTPLRGTSIVVKNGTNGTMSGENGIFELKVEDDTPLVFSFVGYGSKEVKPEFYWQMLIVMKIKTIEMEAVGNKPSDSVNDEEEMVMAVEEMPEFVGGVNALRQFLQSATKYPEIAKANGIQGKVYVAFVISKDGDVTKAKVARGVDPELDNEALRVVNSMPKWKPGKQRGQNIAVGYTVPVIFQISSDSGIQLKSDKRTIDVSSADKPLIVIDGVIAEDQNMDKIDPETIQSITVIKDETATKKYGEKGKNGVLEITLKKDKEVFVVVEELPSFPGGIEALKAFVASTLKYPTIALENRIQGQVAVGFTVSEDGSITDAKVASGVDPSLDQEALRIVNSMPKWKPGTQRGMPVSVKYQMPINFTYPADYHPKNREKLREKK